MIAECPAFPGCASQGRDEAEVLRNVREAIEAWLVAQDAMAVAAIEEKPGRSLVVLAI